MRWIPALLLLAGPALADVTADSSFGFDGTAVTGCVAPIRIELASTEKTPITVLVEVTGAGEMGGASSGGIVHAAEVYLAPGAKKRITLAVLPRRFGTGEWNLTLTAERRTLLRHGTNYADGRRLSVPVGGGGGGTGGFTGFVESAPPVVGVLGDPSRRAAWLGNESRYTRGNAPAQGLTNQNGVPEIRVRGGIAAALPQTMFVSPEAAPDSWLCYEGVDALLWLDPDPEGLKDGARLDALLEYAACGGRLVVALTPGARISGASPLARALPAEASGHDDVPACTVLAAAGGGKDRGKDRKPVPVARIGRTAGRVEARLPDGRPLVVSRSHGLGTVVVLAFDPRLLDAADMEEHARLLGVIFGSVVAAQPDGTGQPQYGASLEPLLNHLRKRFLSTPPLGLLILGLVLYVAAIGPVDYFLLKRKGKLRRTVVTFPLIVIAFTGLAYGSSFLLFGGASGEARVAWLDVATAPGRDADVIRGLDLRGAYSPTGTTLEAAYDQPRSCLGSPWLGTGFYYGGSEGGSLDGTVVTGADGRPAGAFDLPLRSHRTVQARFSGEVPLSLDAVVKTAGGRRLLSLRNGMRLPVRDLCVIRGDRVFFPGDLLPGGAADVDLSGKGGAALGGDPRLPEPYVDPGGFFSRTYGPFGGQMDTFVPAEKSDAADQAARLRMARASMGASVAGLFAGSYRGQARALARQGLDLSRPVQEGRILVMGWCDGDPIGALPPGRGMKSTVVIVRRVLPAEEGP